MQQGYSFIWFVGERSDFILCDGRVVLLEVRDDARYLKPGSFSCRPRKKTKRRSFVCAGARLRSRIRAM
eukprot:5058097-Lingulodinium_polyedra.AAC.1